MKFTENSWIRLALASVLLTCACGGGGTSGQSDASSPSNTCSSAAGNLGVDREGILHVTVDGKQASDGQVITVGSGAIATKEFVLTNTSSGFSALEVAINGVVFTYNASGGQDGSTPAYICEAKDSKGAWQPCETFSFPTVIPTDSSYDVSCASANHTSLQIIRITYHKPADKGARSATLAIQHVDQVSQGGAAKVQTLKVKLTAAVGTPKIGFTPESIDFGTVPIAADSSPVALTVSNLGDGDLTISALTVAKDAPKYFTVLDATDPGAVKTYDGNPVAYPLQWSIAPGSSRTLSVLYHGVDGTGHEAQLVFASDDIQHKDANVPVRGNQNIACIKVIPEKLVQWGAVLVGSKATQKVTLKNCGTQELQLSDLLISDDKDGAFALDNATIKVGEIQVDPKAIPPVKQNQLATVLLDCTPPAITDTKNPFKAKFQFTDNTLVPHKTLDLECIGATTACATPKIECEEGESVAPQSQIHLSGTSSLVAPGKTLTYKWKVLKQPNGTAAYAFFPSDSAAKVQFGVLTKDALGVEHVQLNVVGEYDFQLTVKDSDGKEGCGPIQFTELVVPDNGLHVELLWDTPGDTNKSDTGPDAGADLDLHFAHPDAEKANICTDPLKLCGSKPCACQYDLDNDGAADPWFNDPFDCYWFNSKPYWGNSQAPEDDPVLALDDTDGWGPENLNMQTPESVLYRVGVHSWDAHGYGDSTATVNFYIDGQTVGTFTQLLHECDMWWVKRVDYAQKTLVDFPNSTANGKVTPAYKSLKLSGLGAVCQ